MPNANTGGIDSGPAPRGASRNDERSERMTPQLATKYVFSLAIKVGAPIVAGETGWGLRRVVPILGGELRGPDLHGTIFSCGADFQVIRPNGFTELEAKYAFQMDDG